MTDSDPPTDPNGGATDSAGSDRGAAGGREPVSDTDGRDSGADPNRRATPRLANAPEADEEEANRSTNDPAAVREPEPIEPEGLRAENALFVLLGVLGTVALLATAVVPGVL
jgi:hypothetical protein